MTKSHVEMVTAVTCLNVTVNVQRLIRRKLGPCLVMLLTESQASSIVFTFSIPKGRQGNVLQMTILLLKTQLSHS